MRLQAGVDMRARCRKLGGGVLTKWTLAGLGVEGFLGIGVREEVGVASVT